MSIYLRADKKSPFYQYEFEYNKRRYRGSTGQTTRRAALAIEAELKQKLVQDSAPGRKPRLTLGQLADAWLAESERTHLDYQNDVSRIRKLFGVQRLDGVDMPGARAGLSREAQLHELTAQHLAYLKARRIEEGNSGPTINREFSLIQALVAFAADLGYQVPELRFKRLKSAERPGKLRWLTLDEEKALLGELGHRVEQDRCRATEDQLDLVIVLLDTGLRYTEAATMTRDQISLELNLINPARQKGGIEQPIAMTARVRTVLESRLVTIGHRRYLFPAGFGKTWSVEDKPRGHATSGIQAAINRAGLNAPHLVTAFGIATPHSFRDTFASRLAQAGTQLYEIQKLLGHRTIQMTAKYAKLQPATTAAAAADVLNRLHRPQVNSIHTGSQNNPSVGEAGYGSESFGRVRPDQLLFGTQVCVGVKS
jgi:integrase